MTKLSSTSTRSVSYEYYLLICRADTGAVLLIPHVGADPDPAAPTQWTLPWFLQKERHFWQEVAHVNQATADLLGLRGVTLRCLHTDYNPALERVRTVYAVEQLDPEWTPPPGARWISAAQLAPTGDGETQEVAADGIPFAHPVLADAVASWFAVRPTPPAHPGPGASAKPERVAWYELGWFATAEAWLQQALTRLGYQLTGPIVQVRAWQRSCLLRMETDHGPLFLKAVPAIFAHEPAITHALSSRYPQHIPQVLARHPDRPWFLMRAIPGISLKQTEDLAAWERAVRLFALIQIDLIDRVNRLQALGCPRRPLETLVDQLDQLLGDDELLLPGRPAGLGPDEAATIRAMLPSLRDKARRLAELKLPLTLEHGDFWPGQVLVVPDETTSAGANGLAPSRAGLNGPRPVFIDWSDCSIAHPFFSLSFFDDIMEMEGFLPDVPDRRERLRNAYLGPWTAFAPMSALVDAFELARPLAAIHNAVIYQQQILPGMEQRWEMHYMPPFFLKKLLRNYDRAVVV